jgi:hypothetical protein
MICYKGSRFIENETNANYRMEVYIIYDSHCITDEVIN